jgi:large subunit ribosomal protein L30
MKKVRITWKKSTIGTIQAHRRTIEALGLHRRGHSVVKELTPSIVGMIKSVDYLVSVEELPES